jgi:hypothetical protein
MGDTAMRLSTLIPANASGENKALGMASIFSWEVAGTEAAGGDADVTGVLAGERENSEPNQDMQRYSWIDLR